MSSSNAYYITTEEGFYLTLDHFTELYGGGGRKALVAKQKDIIDYTIKKLLQHEANITRS